jgi:hypothetical protein
LQENFGGDRKAHLLGSLKVDDQIELYWLLDGQVSRIGPFQDLADLNTHTVI